jgi:hypothetical protein
MRRAIACVALLALAGGADAQTMFDQQQRLIDIHSLLLDLPPGDAPGAYRAWEVSLGVEGIIIPNIDGATGEKRQITASDRTPLFPRPRVTIGLPAPQGWRAFAGLAYIPPVRINDVSSHYGALEAGIAWAPGPLAIGVRGHGTYADSRSPVTDPTTRDMLITWQAGADVSAGYELPLSFGSLTPYGAVGVTWLDGRFRVSSDGVVLRSRYTGLALYAGARLLVARHWLAVGELDAYPGRLVHPNFRVAYVFSL